MHEQDIQIQLARDPAEFARCYPVMAQLRPEFSQTAFVDQVQRQMNEGFQLAFLTAGGEVKAVAGFRMQEMLARGRHLYVDDLVTDASSRSAGYGQMLVNWLVEYAREHGCQQLELDSSVARPAAHRFYFRAGFYISAFHFRIVFEGPGIQARVTPGKPTP